MEPTNKKLKLPGKITEEDLKDLLEQSYEEPDKPKSTSYYCEQFALESKKIIDTLVDSKTRITIHARGKSVNTIRTQFYQGSKYLIEHLDVNGIYRKLRAQIKLVTYQNYVELHLKAAKSSAIADFQVEEGWREDLETFLENAVSNQKFHKKLHFTDSDINFVNNLLAGLVDANGEPLFYGKVTNDEILLIRDENNINSSNG